MTTLSGQAKRKTPARLPGVCYSESCMLLYHISGNGWCEFAKREILVHCMS